MNPKLTHDQQRALSSQLGNVTLKLLYKASVHGYTAAAFHQRCDNQGPTLSVGYNNRGFIFEIFGGYTSVSFAQTNSYANDAKAFLFTFKGGNIIKYQVTNPAYAVLMHSSHGPYFGQNFALCANSQAAVYSNPSLNYYNFSAAEMHGNNLKLTECEVYIVEETFEDVSAESKLLEKPWRNIDWTPENKRKLLDHIQTYKPIISSVTQIRVLLIGPVGAGKSSFFNSIKSVFRGHVTNQAMAGSSGTSLTTQFRTYHVKAGKEGKPLPIILCDTMGLEETMGAGLNVDDISSILRGHITDRYQFNSAVPLQPEVQGYKKSPGLQDRIHCVAYVIDSNKISIMPSKLEDKLTAIRSKINLVGIPQLVLLTKVDETCPAVAEDLTNVYHSLYIKTKAQEASQRLGVPLSCVVPVKNYSEELELDQSCDILLLSAVNQMLCLAEDYFDEVTETFSELEVK